MSIGPTEFQDLVRERLPEFSGLLDAHVAEWGRGNMNALLIAAILEEVSAQSKGELSSAHPSSLLHRTFDFMEYVMANGDDNVRSLVEVEFVEGLARNDFIDLNLQKRLGPLGQIKWMRLRRE